MQDLSTKARQKLAEKLVIATLSVNDEVQCKKSTFHMPLPGGVWGIGQTREVSFKAQHRVSSFSLLAAPLLYS